MTLKETVLLKVEPLQYFKSRFKDWNGTGNVLCPWHQEKSGSLKLHVDGGGATCYGCSKVLGNIVHFESELKQLTEDKAAVAIYSEFVTPVVPKIPRLSFDPIIESDLGLNEEWAKYFKLSVDSDQRRINVPIFDIWGNCVNIRRYKPPTWRTSAADRKLKCLSLEGHSAMELFPWVDIDSFKVDQPVFLLKSERCTMLAISLGLQAFCVTAGENTSIDRWADRFKNYTVHIWHDKDLAGQSGASKRHHSLIQAGCDAHIFTSEIEVDFWEWCQKRGGSSEELLARVATLKQSVPTEDMPFINVSDIGTTKYREKKCRVRAIVSGKIDKNYLVPSQFRIKNPHEPPEIYTVPIGRELMRLVRVDDSTIAQIIKQETKITKRGIVEPINFTTISDHIEIIPMASVDSNDKYGTQRCHFVGERIEPNVPYEMEIIPTSDSRSQQAVGLITKITPLSSAMDAFQLTEQNVEKFRKVFSCEPQQSWEKIQSLATSLVKYTRIHSRLDWHMVALLTWTSPLYFNFPHEGKQRGWMNSLVIGDTETGKSKVTKILREIFNCGNFASAENCSYAGLVGGTFKATGDQFMVRWGRIPLCDRQLVILEELSGLSIEEISNLSDVRSSGVARLDKGGHSSETNARTRLICLSNVRGAKNRGRRLSDYLSGVKAIQELIGQPEDISRFDFISTLIDSEVDPNVINSSKDEFLPPSSDIPEPADWQALMQFIWALKEDQIEITKEAYEKILEQTLQLGTLYHASVPIFKASSGRHKLARVACAIACLCFNWNNDRILVEPAHVEAAVAMLQLLYNKPSMGYDVYSEDAYYKENIENEDQLNQTFKLHVSSRRYDTLKYLLHQERFTVDELCSIAGLAPRDANEVMGRMNAANIIAKDEANVWRISKAGKEWMQKTMHTLPAFNGGTIKRNGGLVNGTNGFKPTKTVDFFRSSKRRKR